MLLVGGLVLHHVLLILTNQTSWEHVGTVTYLEDLPDGILPFSRGPLTNCRRFWGTPSHVHVREVMLLPPQDEHGDYETTCWADCC